MSIEALVLALTTVVRPTSATAVVAMLAGRHPQRLLMYYIAAGLAFSLGVGAFVVLVAGLAPDAPARPDRPLVDTVLGVGALCYAGSVWLGWLPRRRSGEQPEQQGRLRVWLRDLTPGRAAAAGVLTHLPGLVYLAALNAIVASAAGPLGKLAQVTVYNVIWFSMAIAALAVSVRRPDAAAELLAQLGAWARRHHQTILVGFFGVLGGYLLLVGVQGLLGAVA